MFNKKISIISASLLLFGATSFANAEVDVDAAKALAKGNDCTKCHAPDKTKKGPSWKKTSTKYKDNVEAQSKVIEAFTKTRKVKMEDGTESDHKPIETKDVKEHQNLANWILSH
jgi:cytochrome c